MFLWITVLTHWVSLQCTTGVPNVLGSFRGENLFFLFPQVVIFCLVNSGILTVELFMCVLYSLFDESILFFSTTFLYIMGPFYVEKKWLHL